jgi:hypothetical protein
MDDGDPWPERDDSAAGAREREVALGVSEPPPPGSRPMLVDDRRDAAKREGAQSSPFPLPASLDPPRADNTRAHPPRDLRAL